MTASRNRRPALLGFLCAGLALAVADLAAAQEPGPIRLTPLAPPPATDSPEPVPDAPAGGIHARKLGAVDSDSVGLLSVRDGGLGYDLWRGSDRATVRRLIAGLPVRAVSPAMRDLMRRLLLTTATAPGGDETPGAFTTARVQALLALGRPGDAADLLRALPGDAEDAALIRAKANALFQTGRVPQACALVAEQVARRDGPYWQKAVAYCQVLAGESEKAALTVSLLRETGHRDDAYFVLADALIAGESTGLERLPDATPVHLAMARTAGVTLPRSLVDSDDPGVLRGVASDDTLEADLRVTAGERAEAAGALSPDILRGLYDSVAFSPEELGNPLTLAAETGESRGRALMYQAARGQTIAAARAEVMAEALRRARAGGRHGQAARVYLPLLDELKPTGDLDWFGPEAVRTYLAAGRPERAARWLLLLRGSARTDPEAARDLAGLMPLARLAGGAVGTAWTPADLARWRATVLGTGGTAEEPQGIEVISGLSRAALLYSLLEAVGETVPEAAWMDLVGVPTPVLRPPPDPAAWSGLRRSVGGERRGETVLFALHLLEDGGTARADPVVLREVVAGLLAAGLEPEARAIAVEAAVAAGL